MPSPLTTNRCRGGPLDGATVTIHTLDGWWAFIVGSTFKHLYTLGPSGDWRHAAVQKMSGFDKDQRNWKAGGTLHRIESKTDHDFKIAAISQH